LLVYVWGSYNGLGDLIGAKVAIMVLESLQGLTKLKGIDTVEIETYYSLVSKLQRHCTEKIQNKYYQK
jgi:hypothetical protein